MTKIIFFKLLIFSIFPIVVMSCSAQALKISLVADQKSWEKGENLPVTLEIKNVSKADISEVKISSVRFHLSPIDKSYTRTYIVPTGAEQKENPDSFSLKKNETVRLNYELTKLTLQTFVSNPAKADAVFGDLESGKYELTVLMQLTEMTRYTDKKSFAKKSEYTQKILVETKNNPRSQISDCQIIRVVKIPLTKKPNVETQSKIVLLNTCLNDEIPRQRPVMEVLRNGEKKFREFEVIKVFADRKEAEKFAEENGLTDIEF